MMWLPIVIYVPALAFNQGFYSLAYSHIFIKNDVIDFLCSSNECKHSYYNSYRLPCLHILHMSRWSMLHNIFKLSN